MEETEKPTGPSRLRWLRYGLRSLFILSTVVCIALGWWVRSVQRQRDAVAAIERLDGKVVYDYYPDARPMRPVPQWAVQRLGRDFFDTVTRVDVERNAPEEILIHVARLPRVWYLSLSHNSHISDRGVAHLAGLRNITHLSLGETGITDSALNIIGGLSRLEELYLEGSAVGDVGLSRLCNLRRLKVLRVGRSDAAITDAGIAQLGQLSSLEQLSLCGAKVTGEALKHLLMLPRLQRLSLSNTLVDESGMNYLARLPALEQLSIDGAPVTASSMEPLAGHRTLQFIDLRNTKIDDAAMPYLASLPNLEVIDVRQTQVTATGLAQLRPLPKLRLIWMSSNLDGDVNQLQQVLPNCRLSQAE